MEEDDTHTTPSLTCPVTGECDGVRPRGGSPRSFLPPPFPPLLSLPSFAPSQENATASARVQQALGAATQAKAAALVGGAGIKGERGRGEGRAGGDAFPWGGNQGQASSTGGRGSLSLGESEGALEWESSHFGARFSSRSHPQSPPLLPLPPVRILRSSSTG